MRRNIKTTANFFFGKEIITATHFNYENGLNEIQIEGFTESEEEKGKILMVPLIIRPITSNKIIVIPYKEI